MMKVLLTNPPWLGDEWVGVRAGSRWPHTHKTKGYLRYVPFPFNMAYAAAVLEKNNIEVSVIDAIALELTPDEFLNSVRKELPDLVVLESSTPSINNDYMYAEKIKEATNCFVAFVGNHVSALPEEVLKNKSIDFGLIGEWDYTLLELAQQLATEKKFYKILGLAFKRGDKIFVTKRRPLLDFNELPFPARHLLPMEKYNETFCENFPNVQMLTSRGCPFKCIFCLEPWVFYGQAYRARNVGLVIEEMKSVIGEYEPKEIYFDDSTFTVSEERTIELCNKIVENSFNIPWSCMTAANCIRSEKMLESMAEAGCQRIKIGLESAAEEVLKNAGKPYDLEHVKTALRWAKDCGIGIHLTVMIGLPGETEKTVEKTMSYVSELAKEGLVHSIQSSVAIPFPGTGFHKMAQENKWLTTVNWQEYDGSCKSVISYPELSQEQIMVLKEKADKTWKYSSVPISLLLRKARRLYNQRGYLEGSYLVLRKGMDYFYHRIVK